jgi:acetyl esterase/lipase
MSAEKGVRYRKCKAPFGPFRFSVPAPFFGAPCGQPELLAVTEHYALAGDIPYRQGDDLSEYMRERCRLDVYHPTSSAGFSTVVWFHGGGLKAGSKTVPKGLREAGVAVVAVNYRLSPRVQSPACIEDAAAAVAWTFRNIEDFGGSRERIFVSGHSVGGYLTSMVGLDKRWLQEHGIDADEIAGLIPCSGHTMLVSGRHIENDASLLVTARRAVGAIQLEDNEKADRVTERPEAEPSAALSMNSAVSFCQLG